MRFVIAVLVVVGLASSSARAETDTEKADKLFVEGRDLMKKNDPKLACEKFHAANTLDPNAVVVMLNLGLCYEQLGKIATSLKWYRRTANAASETNPRATDYEDAATKRKSELAAKVATVKIEGETGSVDVLVDGIKVDAKDLASAVEVDAGSHTVEATAPGKTTYTEKLDIADGQVKAIKIPALKDAPKIAPPPPVEDNRKRNGKLMIVGGSVVLAGCLGLNLYYMLGTGDDASEEDVQRAKDIQRYAGSALFVVGGAAVTIGAVLYFKGRGAERRREATILTPLITPDSIGLGALGRF